MPIHPCPAENVLFAHHLHSSFLTDHTSRWCL
jgi:hypothetical protein